MINDQTLQRIQKRNSQQGKALLEIINWRERDDTPEHLSEEASNLLFRLEDLWEILNDSASFISKRYCLEQYKLKYELSPRQAMIDYDDTFILHGIDRPDFLKGYRALHLERLEKCLHLAIDSKNMKVVSSLSQQIISLLGLDKLSEAEVANREKLRARVVIPLMSHKTEQFLTQFIDQNPILDIDSLNDSISERLGYTIDAIEEGEFEEIEKDDND